MKRAYGRRILALLLAAVTWAAVIVGAGVNSAPALWESLSRCPEELCRGLLRWELGDLLGLDGLSLPTVLALGQSPQLLAGRQQLAEEEPEAPAEPDTEEGKGEEPKPQPSASQEPLPADNGVPAQTVDPGSSKGYTVINGVYLKNKSGRSLELSKQLGDHGFVALPEQGPQVLIVHSHASEAYTMPEGQAYEASGNYRTRDCSCNMVRVGDEIAAVLSEYGISVVHDRSLHDARSYNDAYENSLASIRSYLEKYPSIVYVLDVHRDAVQDADGQQYKLVTAEDPGAAQVSIIMGVDAEGWQGNLRLAIAVQETLEARAPTLMRPITLFSGRYNQFAAPGSMLVEIGAAGNSLEEALRGARLFATGFAETVSGQK